MAHSDPHLSSAIRWIFRLLWLAFFILFAWACMLWDVAGEEVAHVVFAKTYTAISREQTEMQQEIEDRIARDTEWADYNNAHATNQAATYAAILSAFRDQNGDVNRITIDVVRAVNFGSADYDPTAYLTAGDHYAGIYQLNI